MISKNFNLLFVIRDLLILGFLVFLSPCVVIDEANLGCGINWNGAMAGGSWLHHSYLPSIGLCEGYPLLFLFTLCFDVLCRTLKESVDIVSLTPFQIEA